MASARIVDIIQRWHKAGYDTATTARLLKMDKREVQDIIDAETRPAPTKPVPPEFSDVPLF